MRLIYCGALNGLLVVPQATVQLVVMSISFQTYCRSSILARFIWNGQSLCFVLIVLYLVEC